MYVLLGWRGGVGVSEALELLCGELFGDFVGHVAQLRCRWRRCGKDTVRTWARLGRGEGADKDGQGRTQRSAWNEAQGGVPRQRGSRGPRPREPLNGQQPFGLRGGYLMVTAR